MQKPPESFRLNGSEFRFPHLYSRESGLRSIPNAR